MIPRKTHRTIAAVFGLACVVGAIRSAQASSFTDFADDEDMCRQAGSAAIGNATGPEAAARYDMAHGRCMEAHARARWMQAYRQGPGEPPFPRGNPDNVHYPEAYYTVPYATPGYGYDGFSPW